METGTEIDSLRPPDRPRPKGAQIRTEPTVTGGDPMRRSVEVEYWVIDDEGRLIDAGGLVDASPGAEREFVEPLLEIKTTPCETTGELRAELFERVEAVVRRADELDQGLVPLATPMTEQEIEQLPSERTEIQRRAVGDSFDCVRCCAGTHVHLEQLPGREVDQLNVLTALDPALALVNSSPYAGHTPSVPGARSKLYRRSAYEGIDYQGELWPYLDAIGEWERRLEAGYESFAEAAERAGVDRASFESTFDPEGTVWVPVKLRETFSTVEWRSPDTALPSQAVKLAEDLAGIVGRLEDVDLRIDGEVGVSTDGTLVLPEFETIRSHVDAAIGEGIESAAVRAYLDRMGFEIGAYDPIAHEFDAERELTPAEARRIRLEYADRLESDIRRATVAETD